jgi:hypothetical protein
MDMLFLVDVLPMHNPNNQYEKMFIIKRINDTIVTLTDTE